METLSPIAVSVSGAVRLSGLGKSHIYQRIGDGTITAKKSGRRTIVLVASLERYLEGLPSAELGRPRDAA